MAEITFRDETQVMQAEACFDMAMQNVRESYGSEAVDKLSEESRESFEGKLWNNIALSVVKEGYEAAKDYARNAHFVL